jgi:hypothetical protein
MTRWSLALLLTGCISSNKNYLVWPEQSIRVVDAETGKAMGGVSVRFVRYLQPKGTEDESKTLTTDASGEVTLAPEMRLVRTYPLMPAGVPTFEFGVCAEAPGYAGARHAVVPELKGMITLKLSAGMRPCSAKTDYNAPPAGKLRIDGVAKDGSRWLLNVTSAKGRRFNKGDRIGAATVDEVQQVIDGRNVVLFARVAVTGDVSAIHYGDYVDAP